MTLCPKGKCKYCWRCSLQMSVLFQWNDSPSSYFLPETVEIKIICIKIQKGLWSITWTMRLQHRWTGRDDGGLAWGMDGFELELWTHPQPPVGSSVRYNLYLKQIRNHDLNVLWPFRAFIIPPPFLNTFFKKLILTKWERDRTPTVEGNDNHSLCKYSLYPSCKFPQK